MKHRYLILRVLMICVFSALVPAAMAQVNISVQVLPPYLYRITDYASHPNQLLVTVINTSGTQQRLQLRGSITSDNGIDIHVRPTYKGRQPLVLAAGQTSVLSGNDLENFFDPNAIVYTGITQFDFVRGNGLPEGSYRLCVRAYNYDTNLPLSADSPIGCSNLFTISNLEPPSIITPYNEQQVVSNATQIINFSWSTPVGAPPSTMYRIRMVEVLGTHTPNDAIMSAREPYFFEKEVMGNMYVYNPGDPQLTPGRRYALMVQAYDPNSQFNFRNRGQSVVISFTYNLPSVMQQTDVIAKTPVAETPVNSNPAMIQFNGQTAWAYPASTASIPAMPNPALMLNKTLNQSVNQSLASTVPVQEYNRSIVNTGAPGKTQYPLPNATVGLYGTAQDLSTPEMLGTGTSDSKGQYSFSVLSSVVAKYSKLYVKVNPNGWFNGGQRSIQPVNTNTQASVNLGTDVVTLNNFEFTPRVIVPELSNASQITLNVLMNADIWNANPYLKNISLGGSGATVNYNSQNYVVVASLTKGETYKQLPQNLSEGDSYVVQVVESNQAPAYYPLNSIYTSGNALIKPILAVAKNFNYKVSNELDGSVVFNNKGESGVRIRAILNSSDIIGASTATRFDAVTDNDGLYSIVGLPALKSGAVITLRITDRTLQDDYFTDTVMFRSSPVFKKTVLTKPVVGIVGQLVDNNKLPVPNALVTLRNTNVSTKTTANGFYFLKVPAATSGVLEFTADGYDKSRTTVESKPSGPQASLISISPAQIKNSIINSRAVQSYLAGKSGTTFTADDLGVGSGDLTTLATSYFNSTEMVRDIIDVGAARADNLSGTVVLNVKLNGRAVRAKVQLNGLAGNDVQANSAWTYMGAPGNYTFSITPFSDDQPFAQFFGEFNLSKGSYTSIDVALQDGIKLSGTVTAKATSKLLDSATVTIKGLPYTTTTGSNGQYALYLPKGQQFTLSTSRANYLGIDSAVNLSSSATLNLALSKADPSLPYIKTIAGYSVTFNKYVAAGNGTYTVSGKLTLSSNNVFTTVKDNDQLTFVNASVKMGGAANNAVPTADINFEEAVLPVKGLGFAAVEIQGAPQLQLRAYNQNDYSTGVVGGNQLVLRLSNSDVVSKLLVTLPDAVMRDVNATGNKFNYVFTAPGVSINELSSSKSYNLQFMTANYNYSQVVPFPAATDTTSTEIKVGVISSLFLRNDSASLSRSGINLTGYFQFPKAIAVNVGNQNRIAFSNLVIGPSFSIGQLVFPFSEDKPLTLPMQKLKLRLTALTLAGLGTPNVGVTMGGQLIVKKKEAAAGTKESEGDGTFTIKTLSIVKQADGVTLAGSFSLPKEGLSIKSLVFTLEEGKTIDISYSSATKSFAFEVQGGSLDYKSASNDDAGTKSALKSVFPIDIQDFKLRSRDWGVFMAVKPNIKIDLKVVKVNIDHFLVNVGYGMTMNKMNTYLTSNPDATETTPETGDNTTELDEAKASWAIGIAGGIEFPIKSIKAAITGSVLIANPGQGVAVKVNDIGISIENPAFTLDAKVKMQFSGDKQGFEAAAKLTTLTKGFDASFKYYSYASGGIELGASLNVYAEIETGPILWHKIGGGFNFNTHTNVYSVSLTGSLGPAGTPEEAGELKDATVAVLFDVNNCGGVPVVSGSGTVSIATKDWATASVKFDFCKKLMLVSIDGNVPVMAGLGNVNVKAVLFGIVPQSGSTKGQLFLAANTTLSAVGDLASGNIFLALGVNYNNNDPNAPAEAKTMFANVNTSALDNIQTGSTTEYVPTLVPGRYWYSPPTFVQKAKTIATYNAILNAIYVKGTLTVPGKSGSYNVSIVGFNAFGFSYDVGGSGSTELFYRYNNKTFYAAAALAAHAHASATIMGFSLTGAADASINIAGGYDGSWYASGNANLSFSLYNNANSGCNSISATWVECCCSDLHHPCCGNPFKSCCYDWSCTSRTCLGYPSVNFKVCKTLSASFSYRQGQPTKVNFNLF